MKMLISIPCCGQYEIGRISLYCFDQLVSRDTDFLLIDNSGIGSPYFGWKRRYQMARWSILMEPDNIGLVASCQKAYQWALREGYDILCLTHNDVWVYQPYWDKTVLHYFKTWHGELGGVGLFGSKGCGKEGHRLDTFGSLIEMSGHGRKMTENWEPAATFDGFFMCFSMAMLKKAVYVCHGCEGHGSVDRDENRPCKTCHGKGKQVGGFDQRYQWHHMYDLDASLTSIKLGYKNIVINLPCHHLSGLTANNDAKATSGPDVHAANSALFLEKWGPELGVSVDDKFKYTWGQR